MAQQPAGVAVGQLPDLAVVLDRTRRTALQYNVAAQTPQYRHQLAATTCANTPINAGTGGPTQILGEPGRASRRGAAPGRGQPLRRDAGDRHLRLRPGRRPGLRVGAGQHASSTPRTTSCRAAHAITVRGQVQTMISSFNGLLVGLIGAIVLVYLLIVVNFQSWLDPFIIITALPGGAGRHRLDAVPDRTPRQRAGADRRHHVHGCGDRQQHPGGQFRPRAHERRRRTRAMRRSEAGFTRFRPVLMTALAMIIGMVPMALGLGEGGEQNAPLGRAVIGGLVFATVATLFFVPTVFALIHGRKRRRNPRSRCSARIRSVTCLSRPITIPRRLASWARGRIAADWRRRRRRPRGLGHRQPRPARAARSARRPRPPPCRWS